jgi:hypothetical protein
MRVSIKSKNHPKISKEILIVQRDSEILITTIDGEEIGSLVVEIMDKEDPNDYKKVVPCENWWLTFLPKSSTCDMRSADVFVKK